MMRRRTAAIPAKQYRAQENAMHQIIVDNETGEVIADTPIQRKSSLHERSLVQIIAIALLSVLLILNLSYVADQNERINDFSQRLQNSRKRFRTQRIW